MTLHIMTRAREVVIILVCVAFNLTLKNVFVNASQYTLLDQLLPDTPSDVQSIEVRRLIERTVGDNAQNINVTISKDLVPFRSFKLSKLSTNGVLSITGWDGVSAAKGFHHYLKYHLKTDINWHNDAKIELPALRAEWPNIELLSTSANAFIFYQNVCTWSYSFAWWSWSDWRRHIDWMAMMGVSLTIAPVQESIWSKLYAEVGLTDDEIDEHFAGPAFNAWQRMGNMRGWGGPLTRTYRRMQHNLQKRILRAQRQLGISVAVAAFAGHVPRAFERIFPNASLTPVESWNRFPAQYCCSLFLDPNEPLFQEIGRRFVRAIATAYGSNHLYFCDPFNENQPQSADAAYLSKTAHNIYLALQSVDVQAECLLQGWMFVKNVFWTEELTRAFITAVPQNRLLVLDLMSEQFPQYEVTQSYFGQPFIWCMLHNFGGTLGMHGSADIVNRRIGEAARLANSTMVGVGVTPEGIHQNYVMYALALERGWSSNEFVMDEWLDSFADARYGGANDNLHSYWYLLYQTVYNYHGLNRLHGRYTITRRPTTNFVPWTWYDPTKLTQAWTLLLAASVSGVERCQRAYTNDLVDITRQFFQALFDRLYVNLMSAYEKRQQDRLNYITQQMHAVLDDLELILSTHKHFLLGRWLSSAKQMGRNPAERRLYEMNARNQITAWGPNGQILDYATKQWSGIVRDYYHPRWTLFLQLLERSLIDNKPFNNRAFKLAVSNEIENPFTTNVKTYPNDANSNTTLIIAQHLFKKWTATLASDEFVQFATMKVTHLE